MTKANAEPSTTDSKVAQDASAAPRAKGGILAALLRSPLVGADLDLTRPRVEYPKVDI
jgi:hypothetical protein